MVIVFVSCHVPGQAIDSLGEQGYLNLSRTGVSFMDFKLADDFCLLHRIQAILLFFDLKLVY